MYSETVASRDAGGTEAPGRMDRERAHFFGEAFLAAFFFVVFFVALGFLAAFLVLFFAAFGIVSWMSNQKNLDRCSSRPGRQKEARKCLI